MSYTNADAEFDNKQLNWPACPHHGRGCSCCPECGVPQKEAHKAHCNEYVPEETKDSHG